MERNWEEQGERIPCNHNILCEKNLFTIKNKYIKIKTGVRKNKLLV